MTDANDNMDFEYDVLTLLDEEGQEHEFELLDNAEIDGESYMALLPIFDEPEDLLDDSGELVIMKVVEEDGEEYLDAIDNEEEYDKVSTVFTERLSEDFDFED